ncbi:MAG: hypothetical protein HGA28_02610, partial [Anaerolineaceae bacterium]|nr:hypothetical protein [Anaerolineaceae bacterium]
MIKSIPAGKEFSFSYDLKIIELNKNNNKGELWLHSAEVRETKGSFYLTAQTAFAVGTGLQESGISLAALRPDGGWHALGKTEVFISPGETAQNVVLVETPKKNPGNGPPVQFTLSKVQTSAFSKNNSGELVEQRASIGSTTDEKFKAPAIIKIKMDDVVDLEKLPAGKEPYVATYDEAAKVWVKIPIQSTDYEANSVSVEAFHFSTWGAGLGDSLPQNGTGAFLFDQPYTSLFTGAARYSIPIWTPAGRAGLTPNISLSYSSATVDGVLGDVQAPWVGTGWNIDDIEIVRKITTDSNGYGYQNKFELTLNGTLYELIRDERIAKRYYVKQDGFLFIERHNHAFGNDEGVENTSGEWWEVVTTDGTRYRLGWNTDSEQLALMFGYACTEGGDSCITPNGAYASLGYAGIAEDLVVRRWRGDKITDTHGNYITYKYEEFQPDENSQTPAFDQESYLQSIAYTGYEDPAAQNPSLAPGYEIRFVSADRAPIGDIPALFNIWDIRDSRLLDEIQIHCTDCGLGENQPVRTYDLDYGLELAPNDNGSLVLEKVSVTGGGYEEQGIDIPETRMASIQFNYSNLPNRAVSGSLKPFNYPRLISIDNGYGATLAYTYETDGRGTDSWYNYRVKKAEVNSGIGTAYVNSYAYADPVYTGQGSNETLGALVGYTTTTDITVDFINANASIVDIKHTFGTEDLDIGREYTTEWISGTTTLQKTRNVYVTDNSKAPSENWNFRYLLQTENYIKSGSSLSLTSKTIFRRDPQTGNLTRQEDYLGPNLYRITHNEYYANPDPDIYILDRLSRHQITDSSNQVLGETWYSYDGAINTPPAKGDLTFVQSRTGYGSETVDQAIDYDIYGNKIASRVFTAYGTAGGANGGSDQQTSITFDETLHTYPIQATNALGQSSSSDYLFSLGLPYRATDPNEWATTTTYDGLGRVLSVKAPGLGQPGVWYTYPAPEGNGTISAPYAIEMQILDVPASAYRSVWGIYDGLGRTLQTQVHDADSGQLLIVDTSFNPQGSNFRQSTAHFANGMGGAYIQPNWESLDFSEYLYDPLGRGTQVTAPGDLISTTSYDGLTITTTDPNGTIGNQTTDGLGRLVKVEEFNGTTPFATSRYEYDIFDRLVRFIDAKSNETTIAYDWLGRKIGMDDADMGAWSYIYDAVGNLARQTDARGQDLTFQYDDLNRLIEKRDADLDLTLATYGYGEQPGAIGMRTSMSDASGNTSWSYSNYARTLTETRTISGITHSCTTRTDWLGRV